MSTRMFRACAADWQITEHRSRVMNAWTRVVFCVPCSHWSTTFTRLLWTQRPQQIDYKWSPMRIVVITWSRFVRLIVVTRARPINAANGLLRLLLKCRVIWKPIGLFFSLESPEDDSLQFEVLGKKVAITLQKFVDCCSSWIVELVTHFRKTNDEVNLILDTTE